jgi:hypothetical protein
MQKTLLKIGKKEEERFRIKASRSILTRCNSVGKGATYGYFGIYLPLVLGDLICRLTH